MQWHLLTGYHCVGGHPEYIRSNYDTAYTYQLIDGKHVRLVDPLHPKRDEIEQHVTAKTRDWKALGISCSTDSAFPGAGWFRASRTPLRKGWVTESIDGTPVSTLMVLYTLHLLNCTHCNCAHREISKKEIWDPAECTPYPTFGSMQAVTMLSAPDSHLSLLLSPEHKFSGLYTRMHRKARTTLWINVLFTSPTSN